MAKLLVLLFTLLPVAQAGMAKDCLRYFFRMGRGEVANSASAQTSPWRVTQGVVTFKGVALTGKDEFSERVVLNNLDVIPEKEAEWTDERFALFRGKNILSLGEGTSSLVLMLRKNGFDARALDTWYGRDDYPRGKIGTETVEWFLDQYKDSPEALISGDARHTKLPAESQDVVVSHLLVNNFTMADKKRVLMESLRLLTVGGETRHYGFTDDQLQNIVPFLQHHYGAAIEIRSVRKQSEIMSAQLGRRLMDANVLIITKKGKTSEPAVIFPANEEEAEPIHRVPLMPRSGGIQVRGLN